MITLYSGTPGSGKSFHAAKDIYSRFHRGGGLIANFPVKVPDGINPKSELRLSYWDNSEFSPQRLTAYALEYHQMGVEGQTLIVLDEAQVIFNCREYGASDRKDWIKFFTQHRKLGFNILLITQNDRMLDRQIRVLIENEVKHRKLNNYGFGGGLLQLLSFGSTFFIAIEYWYGGNKLLLSRNVFRYNKRIAEIYDSYRMFDDSAGKNSLLELDLAHGEEGLDSGIQKYEGKRFKRFKKLSSEVISNAVGNGSADAPASPLPNDGIENAAVESTGNLILLRGGITN